MGILTIVASLILSRASDGTVLQDRQQHLAKAVESAHRLDENSLSSQCRYTLLSSAKQSERPRAQ